MSSINDRLLRAFHGLLNPVINKDVPLVCNREVEADSSSTALGLPQV